MRAASAAWPRPLRRRLAPLPLLLAALSLLTMAQGAGAETLLYTVPCYGMNVWRAWDEVLEDSVTNMDCHQGEYLLRETLTIYLWKRPMGHGTDYARADSHRVAPCSGTDSFPGQGPGHYYTTARNSGGERCASNQVTILPSILTGVGDGVVKILDPVAVVSLYDVQGRLVGLFPGSVWYDYRGRLTLELLSRGVVRERLATGIYLMKGATKGGEVRRRKVILLR